MARTSVTKEEDDFIRNNYLTMSLSKMGHEIGRGKSTVRRRMKKMGLVVPDEIIESRNREARFKKGRVSENKGKRMEEFMSPEQMAKFKASQFKKGHLPHCTKSDGHISERSDKNGIVYLYIRISVGNWQPLHRVVWEKEHGKIEKGYNVLFKDGNTRNCDISNLELLSNEELLKRNSIHNLPEDLREVIRLNARLNRAIKRKEDA